MAAKKPILGKSKAIKELLKLIERVAPTDTSILVTGESGTGKELVARQIHDLSERKNEAFVAVNCGAIPENLIESELFGHKRGSFTGAVSEKVGLFEAADGGTLFLDEIGELPLSMQVKLLRSLQEKKVRKVGGTEDQKIDVRVIAATNRDLEAAIAKNEFREDLYYRLNVIQLKTPPLRIRKEDLIELCEHFLLKYAKQGNKEIEGFSDEAMDALKNYNWPGNVRELENSIQRCVALTSGKEVSIEVLPASIVGMSEEDHEKRDRLRGRPFLPSLKDGPVNLPEILVKVERFYIDGALHACKGDKKKAAERLGMEPDKVK